jgi:hypothetical protein
MTKKTRLWEIHGRGLKISAVEYEGDGNAELYPLPRQTWLRAIKLVRHHGALRALELIDERAWKAFERGDDKTSRRWRDLIIAIHAIEEDELIPGERAQ